jgi:hypothetical protein
MPKPRNDEVFVEMLSSLPLNVTKNLYNATLDTTVVCCCGCIICCFTTTTYIRTVYRLTHLLCIAYVGGQAIGQSKWLTEYNT